MWLGAAGWLAFAVVGVAVKGVAWDEAYERGQVLTGAVTYPAWHPLYLYAHRAAGVHYDLGALVLRITEHPLVLCGIRNVLHVWLVALPVFLAGTILTGRTRWGHFAALLAVLGVHRQAASYYPLPIWPDMFTNGPIGLGFALCVVAAFMAGRPVLGAGLLGAMPLVHVGQMPPLLVLAGLLVVAGRLSGARAPWRRIATAFGMTLAVSVSYLVWKQSVAPAIPDALPFALPSTPHDAWIRYTLGSDVHRAYPRYGSVTNSVIAMGGLIVTAWVGALVAGRRNRDSRPYWIVWLYGVVCAGLFAAGALGQAWLQERTPFWLVAWMPHRLPNHAGVLLLPVLAGLPAAAGRPSRTAGFVAAASLAVALVAPLSSAVLPATLAQRYVAPPEMVGFFLAGAGLALGLPYLPRPYAWVMAGIVALTLALFHQTGLAWVLTGGALVFALQRAQSLRPHNERVVLAFATVLGMACVAHVLYRAAIDRAQLPEADWESAIARALDENGGANGMIAAPHAYINLQERLGHPVLVTYETHQFTPYLPEIAPIVEAMYRDVYGQTFGERWDYSLDAWAVRSRAEWRDLAARYTFAFVLAPATVDIDLPQVAVDGGYGLYDARPE